MNTTLLKKLYSIYSPSGNEQRMIGFLCSYISRLPGNISLAQDCCGNLYVTKGESDTYPCLASHIDQVSFCHYSGDFEAVETEDIIFGYSSSMKRFENLGADDKNGIFVCLECLKKFDTLKAVFFREEETGCRGSGAAYMPFFDNVRFVIQPDRKGNSDLVTAIGPAGLCSEPFIEAVEPGKWGYRETKGLATDVLALKENGLDVSCANVSCGYYNAHTDEEITVKKDLRKCLRFVGHIIEDCTSVYPHQPADLPDFSLLQCEDIIHRTLDRDPMLTPEELRDIFCTHFTHLTLDDYDRIYGEYWMMETDTEDMEGQTSERNEKDT